MKTREVNIEDVKVGDKVIFGDREEIVGERIYRKFCGFVRLCLKSG